MANLNNIRRLVCAAVAAGFILSLAACATTADLDKERRRRYSIDQFNIGLDFERKENYSRAIEHYQKSLNSSPTDETGNLGRPATYYHLGHCYLNRGELYLAQEHFEKALELNPEYKAAQIELEKVKLQLAQADDAEGTETGEAATGVSPEATPIFIPPPPPSIAEVERRLFPHVFNEDQERDPNEEKRIYTYVMSRKLSIPSNEYHRRQAESFAARGLLDEAIGEYQDAIIFDPADIESRLGLARVFERVGRIKRAEEDYLRTVELFPESAEAQFQTANFYFRQELFSDAEYFYKEAVEIDPEYRSALNNLGATQIKQENYKAAQLTFERLLEVDPRFLNAHLNLGILFDDHLSEPDKAIYHYERYLELGGADAERVNNWIAELEQQKEN